MEIALNSIVQRKKSETVVSTALLICALALFFFTVVYFKQKLDYGVISFIFVLIVALIARYWLTVYRINKGFYGNTEDECLEILKELSYKKFIDKEKDVSWWVDTNKLRIEPVAMIHPVPSLWQRFTNLFRGAIMHHHKYFFQCINNDGSMGKKVTGNRVFADIVDAVIHVKRLKGEQVDFQYGYQSYPWDNDPQYFWVTAINQEEANKKAEKHFIELVNKNMTVMREYWLVKNKK